MNPDTDLECMVVLIGNPAGTVSWKYDIPKKTKIGGLKQMIAEDWNTPASCQKLISSDGKILEDEYAVSLCLMVSEFHADDAGPLELTMVVSLDKLERGLRSGRVGDQLKALSDCRTLGKRAGAIVPVCLDSQVARPTVMRKALELLEEMGTTDDEPVIASIISCLHHPDLSIRARAVITLDAIADEEKRSTMDMVLEEWSHKTWQEREEALWRIETKSKDENAVALIAAAALSDKDMDVRARALDILCKVVTLNNNFAIKAISKLLNNPAWDVKIAALQALSMAHKGGSYTDDLLGASSAKFHHFVIRLLLAVFRYFPSDSHVFYSRLLWLLAQGLTSRHGKFIAFVLTAILKTTGNHWVVVMVFALFSFLFFGTPAILTTINNYASRR